jgi:hypothetical protein
MLDLLYRSRAFTPAFKLFAALAGFGVVAAFVSAIATEDQGIVDMLLGPITMGWKGGVGNQTGYTVLVSLAVVAGVLAGILVAFRDADPEAEAEVAHTETVPLTRAPSGTNFLPMLGALSVLVIVLSQVAARWVLYAGFGLLLITIFTWTLRAWAERATGDEEVNREIYTRFVEPLRVPVVSAILIAVGVLALSRVLLAVSKTGAVAVFAVVGTLILFGMALLAARPQISKNAITIGLFIGAIVVVIAGIVAAVVGEREIEEHGGDHGGEGAESVEAETEAGLAPPAELRVELPPGVPS